MNRLVTLLISLLLLLGPIACNQPDTKPAEEIEAQAAVAQDSHETAETEPVADESEPSGQIES